MVPKVSSVDFYDTAHPYTILFIDNSFLLQVAKFVFKVHICAIVELEEEEKVEEEDAREK